MAYQELTLAQLKDFDLGKVDMAFQLAMRRAAQDCNDRPGNGKPRVVKLELAMIPIREQDGSCDTVKAEFRVDTTLPRQVSKTYEFIINKSGHMKFAPDSPEAVDQRTLDFDRDD